MCLCYTCNISYVDKYNCEHIYHEPQQHYKLHMHVGETED